MSVPAELQRDIEDAFFLFCYDDSKKVTHKEVGAVIRSVGLNPTEEELKGIINSVNTQGGSIDVAGLCRLLAPCVEQLKTSQDVLVDALLAFDKNGNRTISVADLKHALITLGERLTPEIVDELVREVDQDGEGQVSVDDVAHALLKK